MTTRAISLPLSCFIYRLSEPKPIEKWSTFIKINEESFSNLKKRFVIDGYGGFQDKARECGIEKLNFSFGVKHKKPEPPDFPNGRLFTVNSEDEWQIYQEFLFGEISQITDTQVNFYGKILALIHVDWPGVLKCL